MGLRLTASIALNPFTGQGFRATLPPERLRALLQFIIQYVTLVMDQGMYYMFDDMIPSCFFFCKVKMPENTFIPALNSLTVQTRNALLLGLKL